MIKFLDDGARQEGSCGVASDLESHADGNADGADVDETVLRDEG